MTLLVSNVLKLPSNLLIYSQLRGEFVELISFGNDLRLVDA